MPDSKRRTSSSRHPELASVRNDGIYIVGETKIIIKNSGSMGCDMFPTPNSTKGGRLDTALLFLCHPRWCFSQIRHHRQEGAAPHRRTGGFEYISPGGDLNGRSESGSRRLRSYENDGMAGLRNERAEGASYSRHSRHSSRQNRGRSRPSSHQSHPDPALASPLHAPKALDLLDTVQEPHYIRDDSREGSKRRPYTHSDEFDVLPPQAINPYAPMHGEPVVLDQTRSQSYVEEDPALYYWLRDDLLGVGSSRSRPHYLSSLSSSHTRPDQDSMNQKAPPKPPRSFKPKSAPEALAPRNEAIRRDQPQQKPEVPPRPSKTERNERKGKRNIITARDKALMNDLDKSARFQKQKEKLV